MYQLSGSSSLVAHYSFCASDPADQLSSFCECVCVWDMMHPMKDYFQEELVYQSLQNIVRSVVQLCNIHA